MHKYYHDKPFAFLWVDPTALDEKNCDDILQEAHGFVLPGGFGDIGVNGLMLSIKYARTHNKPILGLCLGFQMMVCEFARNVCGLSHANSTEMDPDTPHKLIIPISEMLETGQIKPLHKQQNAANPGTTAKYSTMRLGDLLVSVKSNTMLSECYNKYPQVKERHWHSFAVNTQYIDTLTEHGLIISGMDFTNQLPMAVELPTEAHPFFMATQYHPEFTSKHRLPHTLFCCLCIRNLQVTRYVNGNHMMLFNPHVHWQKELFNCPVEVTVVADIDPILLLPALDIMHVRVVDAGGSLALHIPIVNPNIPHNQSRYLRKRFIREALDIQTSSRVGRSRCGTRNCQQGCSAIVYRSLTDGKCSRYLDRCRRTRLKKSESLHGQSIIEVYI